MKKLALRWPKKQNDFARCPCCYKKRYLVVPFDEFYIPENQQEKICEECLDVLAEKQYLERYST